MQDLGSFKMVQYIKISSYFSGFSHLPPVCCEIEQVFVGGESELWWRAELGEGVGRAMNANNEWSATKKKGTADWSQRHHRQLKQRRINIQTTNHLLAQSKNITSINEIAINCCTGNFQNRCATLKNIASSHFVFSNA